MKTSSNIFTAADHVIGQKREAVTSKPRRQSRQRDTGTAELGGGEEEEEGRDQYSISSGRGLTDFCNTPPTLE